MSYKVDRFNGTFLTNVADGSIDTTTDLRFIGKNYAGYGEIQNENFLHLMENFANTSPPAKPQIGQIWYDSNAVIKKLKFWDGSQWKVASGAVSRPTAPAGLTAGDFWFDTSTNQLYIYSIDQSSQQGQFILVGPETTPELDSTTTISEIVKDVNDTNHSILRVVVLDNTIMIFSNTEFDIKPNVYNWAQGKFSRIKKGATLAFTFESGISGDNFNVWGTSSVSRGILGPNNTFLGYEELVLQSQRDRFTDNGLFVGVTNINNLFENGKLRIFVQNGLVPVFENLNFSDNQNSLVFRLRTDSSGGNVDPLIVSRNSVYPGITQSINLGRSDNRWDEVFARSYFGNLTGNVSGNTTGIHKGNITDATDTVRFDSITGTFFGTFGSPSNLGTFTGTFTGNLSGTADNADRLTGLTPSDIAESNTVVIRNNSADIVANKFIGTSSKADQLLVGSAYRSASIGQVANTVAARDSNADITARIFNGTATSAQYADLAEKYLPDSNYEVGTVVVVGGEKEVTASSIGDRAIGVISANPAFMMNKDLEGGVYIALKGRVPVRVFGPVQKGQRLVAHDSGTAIVDFSNTGNNVFAIALETNLDSNIKNVEAVIL